MKKESVGAIWKKQTSKGELLSITIEGKRYTAWVNSYKKSDKEPDYKVFVDDFVPKQQTTHVPKSVVDKDDDMPF